MIKPILKIEAPSTLSEEDFDKMNTSLQDAELTKEYHVLLVTGNTDYFSFEIITAKDASIHKP